MRTKQIVPGIKNSHKFRAIVNGVGFYMTVNQMQEMPFTSQRIAVWQTLEHCVVQKLAGFSQRVKVYNDYLYSTEVDVQVKL
jgi:hypothetical protein